MSKSSRTDLAALGAVLDALEPLTEHEREWILRTAASRLGVPAMSSSPSTAPTGGSSVGTASVLLGHQQGATTGQTPKRFLAEKQPANDVQKVACLAYFLTHHRQQQHFKTLDLTQLNTEAAGARIGNPAQAVANATTVSGYLAASGGGKKQITAMGERIVEALPDREAVRKVLAEKNPRRRARRSNNRKANAR